MDEAQANNGTPTRTNKQKKQRISAQGPLKKQNKLKKKQKSKKKGGGDGNEVRCFAAHATRWKVV